jgi:hypothetical protein
MANKARRRRAKHEGGHAVIARKLGLKVTHVNARADSAGTERESVVALLSATAGVATWIEAYETDAMVALAGYAADGSPVDSRRDVAEGFTQAPGVDLSMAICAVLCIVYLRRGQPLPQHSGTIKIDPATRQAMEEVYGSIAARTSRLVQESGPAIARVAKHLESHDIDDQAALDHLIAIGERGTIDADASLQEPFVTPPTLEVWPAAGRSAPRRSPRPMQNPEGPRHADPIFADTVRTYELCRDRRILTTRTSY